MNLKNNSKKSAYVKFIFRKWCAEDVFENILQALVADTEKYLLVEIDSTFSCG